MLQSIRDQLVINLRSSSAQVAIKRQSSGNEAVIKEEFEMSMPMAMPMAMPMSMRARVCVHAQIYGNRPVPKRRVRPCTGRAVILRTLAREHEANVPNMDIPAS